MANTLVLLCDLFGDNDPTRGRVYFTRQDVKRNAVYGEKWLGTVLHSARHDVYHWSYLVDRKYFYDHLKSGTQPLYVVFSAHICRSIQNRSGHHVIIAFLPRSINTPLIRGLGKDILTGTDRRMFE